MQNMVFDPAVPYQTAGNSASLSIIDLVREGVKYTVFQAFCKSTPFSTLEWSRFLHLSDRTMLRYQTENKTFDSLQSEKIVEIALLYKKGTAVFGSTPKFNTWLETESLALGRILPKSLFDSSFGIQLLKNELEKLEHGILA